MKKRLLSLLTAFCVGAGTFFSVAPTAVSAATLGDNTNWSFDTETGELTILSNDGTTGWRNSNDIQRSDVTSVTIQENVTSIGLAAFRECSSLKSIELPDTVTSIGEYAFEVCGSLESIKIPSGVTSIGGNAFHGCTSLKSVTLPENVTSIGDSAFNKTGLTSITIPAGVTSIGAEAFRYSSELTSVTILTDKTTVESTAFSNCSNLDQITYPDGLEVTVPSKTSKIEYTVDNDGAVTITDITLGSGKTSVELPTEINDLPITEVDESLRDKVSESGHTHDDESAATCTKGAVCKICGEHGDPLGHSYTNYVPNNDATCTENGTETAKCDNCDETDTREIENSATGHSFDTTWSKDETYHWYAATCGHNDQTKDKAEHTWNDGEETTPATCTEKGVKTLTCTVCGATKTEEIAALDHDFDDGEVTTAPTCTAKGVQTFTCKRAGCGATKAEDLPALDHDFDDGVVTTAPTCTEKGVKTFTCKRDNCGATKTEEIAATGHRWNTVWSADENNHWHNCLNDDCEATADLAAHEDDGGKVTTAPTTEREGERTYSCKVCEAIMRKEPIAKLDPDHTHTFGADWKSDSTNHWHECDCGEKADQAAHTEDNGAITTEPTLEQEGVKTYSCAVCGVVLRTEPIDKLTPEHTHTFATAWTSDDTNHWHAATCEHTEEVSDKAAHTWNDGVISKFPTETEKGLKLYTCTTCQKTKSEELPTVEPETKPGYFSSEGETSIKNAAPKVIVTEKTALRTANNGVKYYNERIVQKVAAEDVVGKTKATFTLSNGTVTKTVSTTKYNTALTVDGEKVAAGEGYVFLVYTLTDIPEGINITVLGVTLE
ncbi:MAG: leucine-rich repeat domain-containing protein [Bacteroides sp.]|nr:leucine-rich repeat domain-containing protein [Eubacterium sp.]MCM1419499.1 leucine-rich repeat domain-containing protein [Roseburia sp.]MCM1463250.1 leucine-rich repeat domain-containing protein [Bacteroides sp.]